MNSKHQEMELVFVIDVVSTHDIRMIEPSDSLGFTIKARQRSGVFGLGDGQHFQGHAPPHHDVFA